MKSVARYAALLALPLMIACDDDGTGPTVADVAGTYSLQTVNNEPLPYIIQQATDFRLELTDIFITLNENGTFNEEVWYREVDGAIVTEYPEDDGGTFVVDGDEVELHYTGGGVPLIGTIDGTSLRFSGNGLVFVFRQE